MKTCSQESKVAQRESGRGEGNVGLGNVTSGAWSARRLGQDWGASPNKKKLLTPLITQHTYEGSCLWDNVLFALNWGEQVE